MLLDNAKAFKYTFYFWFLVIGLILSSAFSAILVYAQELLPMKLGLISGLFFGLAFGIAGISAAIMGNIADEKGIEYIYHLVSFMPLLGIVTYFLPNVKRKVWLNMWLNNWCFVILEMLIDVIFWTIDLFKLFLSRVSE